MTTEGENKPKIVKLILFISIPIITKKHLAIQNMDPNLKKKEYGPKLLETAKSLLQFDLDEPFRLMREATDKRKINFTNFDIVAHTATGKGWYMKGIFKATLICEEPELDKWKDFKSIKRATAAMLAE